MTNHEVAEIQALLLARRKELANRLERIKENLTSGHSADSQEQAQELENAEVVDALGNEARLSSARWPAPSNRSRTAPTACA